MIPVETQIMDIIGARLANITTGNEYFSTVQKIERARTAPFKNADLPALTYYYSTDILVKPLNTSVEERSISVIIEYYDITRDSIFLDIASQLAADIKIAIERDLLAPKVSDQVSNRLGKKVMKLEYDSITPVIGEGQSPYCGVIMVLSVSYRIDRHDPFTLID